EVSYTVIGGLSSPPNRVGVVDCTISRIGTRRSGREPGTWILREPGIGRVTASDSFSAWRISSVGTAFMARAPVRIEGCRAVSRTTLAKRGASGREGAAAKLPYAGVNRIRFEGSVSTRQCRVPPLRRALCHVLRRLRPARASVRRGEGASWRAREAGVWDRACIAAITPFSPLAGRRCPEGADEGRF